jgi:hypothetical protein
VAQGEGPEFKPQYLEKKMFANHVSYKALVTGIYEKVLQRNN